MREMAPPLNESAADWQFETGGYIEGLGQPAFYHRSLVEPRVPILVASPHAGRSYPSNLLEEARYPRIFERRLEDRYVEQIAEAISSQIGASLLVANAPRAMLDLNRSEDDIDWGMIVGGSQSNSRASSVTRRARTGLGLIPRRLAGVGELWQKPLKRSRLEARIDGIHRPYHQKLASELERLRDAWGYSILIDLHSMPPLARADQATVAIDFVVGDRFGTSCDSKLSYRITSNLRSNGRGVSQNRPYSGCYTLDRHGRPRRNIHAVQIEVCRTTYLDADLDRPTSRRKIVSKLISGAILSGLSCLSDVGIAAE